MSELNLQIKEKMVKVYGFTYGKTTVYRRSKRAIVDWLAKQIVLNAINEFELSNDFKDSVFGINDMPVYYGEQENFSYHYGRLKKNVLYKLLEGNTISEMEEWTKYSIENGVVGYQENWKE